MGQQLMQLDDRTLLVVMCAPAWRAFTSDFSKRMRQDISYMVRVNPAVLVNAILYQFLRHGRMFIVSDGKRGSKIVLRQHIEVLMQRGAITKVRIEIPPQPATSSGGAEPARTVMINIGRIDIGPILSNPASSCA